jgi:hypothetical protein
MLQAQAVSPAAVPAWGSVTRRRGLVALGVSVVLHAALLCAVSPAGLGRSLAGGQRGIETTVVLGLTDGVTAQSQPLHAASPTKANKTARAGHAGLQGRKATQASQPVRHAGTALSSTGFLEAAPDKNQASARSSTLPGPVAVQPYQDDPPPEHRYTSRSRIFAGAAASVGPVLPRVEDRSLASWAARGLKMSLGPVLEGLRQQGDGRCVIEHNLLEGEALHFVCDNAALSEVRDTLAPAVLDDLSTWLRGGFIARIELTVAAGQVTYQVH